MKSDLWSFFGSCFWRSSLQLASCLFFVSFLCSSCGDTSAPECADPSAINFNADAIGFSDCEFDEHTADPEWLTFLDQAVEETSGLAIVNDRLITHNDRGHSNELFVVDPETGLVLNTFEVVGAENEDWEDLAQSDEILFVGDMGNNPGDRKNLRIYMVKKSDFDFGTETGEVTISGLIEFYYPEQEVFEANNNHNWDCEALIYREGYLYLFMKHRKDPLSNLYRIPAEEGSHTAQLLAYFNAGHRITGGDISPDGNQIALVGYNKDDNCVVWLLDGFGDGHPLSGSKRMFTLGSFSALGQIEAIVYTNDSTFYISAEEVDGIPPRLYRLELP
ncbi:MAG: hypothetical protein EA411_10330 [Saprospirales bacterium]|nr:MAG: hypothetical protein EA411_10330 [Saprospirales bacterium]